MAQLNWSVGQGGGIVEKDEEDQQSSTEEAQEQADMTAVYEDDPRTDPSNWDGDTGDLTASWGDAGISGIDNGGSSTDTSTSTSSTDEVRNPESTLGGSSSTSDLDPSGAGNDGDDASSTTDTKSNYEWSNDLATSDGSKSGGGTETTTTTTTDDPKGTNTSTDTSGGTPTGTVDKDDEIPTALRNRAEYLASQTGASFEDAVDRLLGAHDMWDQEGYGPGPDGQWGTSDDVSQSTRNRGAPNRDPTSDPEPMRSVNENGRAVPAGRPALGGREFRGQVGGGGPPKKESSGESKSGSGLGGITSSPVMLAGGMGLVAVVGYLALGFVGVL